MRCWMNSVGWCVEVVWGGSIAEMAERRACGYMFHRNFTVLQVQVKMNLNTGLESF